MTKLIPYATHEHRNGVQKMYRFDNGYGASVIRHDMSYGHESGLWELAVLRFVKDRWDICYTTDIADDVVGHLDGEEVEALLQKISQLSQ